MEECGELSRCGQPAVKLPICRTFGRLGFHMSTNTNIEMPPSNVQTLAVQCATPCESTVEAIQLEWLEVCRGKLNQPQITMTCLIIFLAHVLHIRSMINCLTNGFRKTISQLAP